MVEDKRLQADGAWRYHFYAMKNRKSHIMKKVDM